MQWLHENLRKQSKAYKKWHQHPRHSHWHWGVLGAAVFIFGLGLLAQISSTQHSWFDVTNLRLARAIQAQSSYNRDATYEASGASDQDDMAIWIHPTDRSKSVIYGSNKDGNIFVYDLNGSELQTIQSPKPGNIDIRYNVSLGGQTMDIVAHNERGENTIRAYRVGPDGRLTRIDDGSLSTDNYGFALSYDGTNLYAYTGPKSSTPVRRYLAQSVGSGQLKWVATNWVFQPGSTVEGMVADEEQGVIFVAEEAEGTWRVDLNNPDNAELVSRVGSNGLRADQEGIALYRTTDGGGYVVVSNQGANSVAIFDRRPPHTFRALIDVGTSDGDGLDVTSAALGPVFPNGVLLAHAGGAPIYGVDWKKISDGEGLADFDNTWDPRGDTGGGQCVPGGSCTTAQGCAGTIQCQGGGEICGDIPNDNCPAGPNNPPSTPTLDYCGQVTIDNPNPSCP